MPIGLSLPIRNGSGGYFESTMDTMSMYRFNLINLLNTIPGERRFNPLFGCRLWKFAFEPNDDLLITKIENTIKEDVSKWIMGITITKIEVQANIEDGNVNPKDIYKLHIKIEYTVDFANQQDSIDIILNPNIH